MKEIWRNFSKSQIQEGSSEFFQVPEPWRKLGIFLSFRNMKEYEEVWRNYEENMKEYEEIWRKCEEIWRKYENKDSPYVWAVKLRKILISSSYFGGRGVNSQFPSLGMPQRKDMKHVNKNNTNIIQWRNIMFKRILKLFWR